MFLPLVERLGLQERLVTEVHLVPPLLVVLEEVRLREWLVEQHMLVDL